MNNSAVNPTLLSLAQTRLDDDVMQKIGFVPAGAPAMDPAAAGAGAMPPGGDPAAMGGMPPGMPPGGDPAAMGGMPPGGDPMAGGMPMDPMTGMPMDPAMAAASAAPPVDPAAAGGAAGAAPKRKPEEMMAQLDFRLYNLQQQLTVIMEALKIQLPADALNTPPGMVGAPPMESAQPIPQESAAADDPAAGGGMPPDGGGMPPEAAAMPEKMAAEHATFMQDAAEMAPEGYHVILVKSAVETTGPTSSPPNQALNVPGSPAKTPSIDTPSSGGSKDPKSVTDASKQPKPPATDDNSSKDDTEKMSMGQPYSLSDIREQSAEVQSAASAAAAILKSRYSRRIA